MSKVKVIIEFKDDKKEFECDLVLFGGANIDYKESTYPRIAVHGAMMGNCDLLSLNRIYASIGGSVHDINVKEIYNMSVQEARESISDLLPVERRLEESDDGWEAK